MRPSIIAIILGLSFLFTGCEGTITTVGPGGRTTVRHFGQTYPPPYRHTFAEPPPSQSDAAPHVETLEEKRNRLAVQLGISLGVKIGTRPAPDDDLVTSFLKALGSSGADYVIEATIDEAFPEETPLIRRQVSNVIEALFEGDFTLSTLGERNDKQALIDFLQQRSPEAAQSTEIIDFLYRVYQGAHAR